MSLSIASTRPYSEDRLVALSGMVGEFDLPLQFRIKHTRHTYLIGNYLDLGALGDRSTPSRGRSDC